MFREVFKRFTQATPVSVMTRALLANVVSEEIVNDLFARHACKQRPSELLFSVVIDLLMVAVCRVRPSVHAAYQARGNVGTAIKSVYNKLNGVETQVSRHLVRETAARFSAVVDELDVEFAPLVPGYRARILDGNHLAATEHRLKELRRLASGPLPGQALVVLDGDRRLVLDVYPCEDGHTQERTILAEVLNDIEAGEVWIADRAYCTSAFLWEVSSQACFLVRQHATNVRWETAGRRRLLGKTDTGKVYEQVVTLHDGHGSTLSVRRVTVVLDEPTESGDRELHLLTNLPSEVSSLVIADAYRGRWRIEGAFCELDAVFENEISTLAYPSAALLAFCLSLLAYNLLRVIRACLAAEHGVAKIEQEVSSYYLGDEIGGAWDGLMIALPPEFWTKEFGKLTTAELVVRLRELASQVSLKRFRKHPRGPKKPQPKRRSAKGAPHVSTAKLLARRRK